MKCVNISTPQYVNDLKNALSLDDPIMFADGSNIFYNHENIHCLFSGVNKELTNINEWFVAKNFYWMLKKSSILFFISLVRRTILLFNYQI